jgi:integrase
VGLTQKQIDRAKPGRLSDGNGLYLLVKPKPADPEKAGSMSWVLRVQYRGNRRDFGLGSFTASSFSDDYERFPIVRRKALTLAEARKKAEIGRQLAKQGIDPNAEWHREELVIPTFETAAREYHNIVVTANATGNKKHKAQWLTTLETYAFSDIGDMLVSDITASDIQTVLNKIWLVVPETARRVRQRIFVILDYCKAKEWRDTEAPARAVSQLMNRIKQPSGGNFEALPWSELPALISRLRASDVSVGRFALQFLILTAARSGEVRGATWREFDLDGAEWKIPAERMKGKKLHIVPLVPAAVDILRQMQGLFGGKPDEPVFPGQKGKPMSDATLAKVLRVAGGGGATVHGMRSTFRDWAAESGFANDWAEAALAHSIAGQEGKTAAAYKRTTFFEKRRDKLMPAWARYALEDESNVVALAAAR